MSVREGENRVFANSSFDVSLAAPSAEASSRDSSRDGTGVEIVLGTGGGGTWTFSFIALVITLVTSVA